MTGALNKENTLLVISEAHERRECRNSSAYYPVEKGPRKRSCCVCEGGLWRKHDVRAERVSAWGERTKGRNREEKKGVSSLR